MKGTCVFLWKKIFLQDKINFPWAFGNFIRLKKAKFNLLHLAQWNSQYQYSLGEKGIQRKEGLGSSGGQKRQLDQHYAPTDQRANQVLREGSSETLLWLFSTKSVSTSKMGKDTLTGFLWQDKEKW